MGIPVCSIDNESWSFLFSSFLCLACVSSGCMLNISLPVLVDFLFLGLWPQGLWLLLSESCTFLYGLGQLYVHLGSQFSTFSSHPFLFLSSYDEETICLYYSETNCATLQGHGMSCAMGDIFSSFLKGGFREQMRERLMSPRRSTLSSFILVVVATVCHKFYSYCRCQFLFPRVFWFCVLI